MKEIITNEFIAYKAGFIAGKDEIIENYKLGQIIKLNEEKEAEETKNWYTYGYEDGIHYYGELIDNQSLDLEKMNTKAAVKECFAERVIRMNAEEGKEIPIGKFRI